MSVPYGKGSGDVSMIHLVTTGHGQAAWQRASRDGIGPDGKSAISRALPLGIVAIHVTTRLSPRILELRLDLLDGHQARIIHGQHRHSQEPALFRGTRGCRCSRDSKRKSEGYR